MENDKHTMVVSAFPGTGKTHYYLNCKDQTVMDSDSSTFDKSDFPANYIRHIKENIGKADIIFVSSHKEVRDALITEGIEFTLIYPRRELMFEYLVRFVKRGSPDAFVELLEDKWNEWMTELENQTGCVKIRLGSRRFISNVLPL